MFSNLFDTDPQKADQANQSIAIQLTTLNLAMLDKGLISETEFEQYRAQAVHLVQELWAKHADRTNQLTQDADSIYREMSESDHRGDDKPENPN